MSVYSWLSILLVVFKLMQRLLNNLSIGKLYITGPRCYIQIITLQSIEGSWNHQKYTIFTTQESLKKYKQPRDYAAILQTYFNHGETSRIPNTSTAHSGVEVLKVITARVWVSPGRNRSHFSLKSGQE